MIAKIVQGRGFQGAVNYILDKENASLLYAEGVRLKDKESIIHGFVVQHKLNPNISKPVAHISLDFSVQDKSKLTDRFMVDVAHEYMKKMGYRDTQYIIVRHHDTDHPHIHLVINRIDNNGKRISDQNERLRNVKICMEITKENSLYIASGKENVKEHRLKEPDKTKYEIYNSLKKIIPKCQNWDQIIRGLNDQNIGMKFKYKGKSDEIQGVIFDKNGYTFNGSKVDRQFSFSKINQQLQLKEQKFKQVEYQNYADNKFQNQKLSTGNIINDLLFQLQKPSDYNKDNEETAAIRKYRKKKRKDFRFRP